MAFMPQSAPIVVLLFLATVLTVMLAAAVFVYGLVRRQPRVRRWAAAAAVAIPAGYLALLLGTSLTSQDRVLGPGGKKYFCEIDCHLAYPVERVAKAKTLGIPPHRASANGIFYLVSLPEPAPSIHRGLLRPPSRSLFLGPARHRGDGLEVHPAFASPHPRRVLHHRAGVRPADRRPRAASLCRRYRPDLLDPDRARGKPEPCISA